MDITISGEFAQRIMALTRKDRALALAFAQQLMASVEPAAISRFLLTREAALALLTERLRKHPEQTLAELRRLAEGRGVASARGAGQTRPAAAPGKRRRRRLSTQQIEQLKAQIVKFLSQHPWSNRKQITAGCAVPTQAIYNRLMAELKEAGAVTVQGTKSKAVYAVKGAAKPAAKPAGAAAKPAGAAAKPAGAAAKAATSGKPRKARRAR